MTTAPGRQMDRPAASGRFAVGRIGDRWTLIDPAGRPFFALGVNHIDALGREPLFEAFGGDWTAAGAWVCQTLADLGYTNAGYGAPDAVRARLPFFAHGYISEAARWREAAQFGFRDVFDPEYQRQIHDMAAAVTRATRDHPNLIGHYWADLIHWDIDRCRAERGVDWVSFTRGLPATAAGKRAYVEFLLERHGGPQRVAEVYGRRAATMAQLLADGFERLDLSRGAIRGDDEAFLGRIASTLFATMAQAYRAHAPDGLIFGDRFDAMNCPDVVLDAIAPLVDAVAIQWGAEVEGIDMIRAGRFDLTRGRGFEARFDRSFFDRIHRRTGKPVILCDHHISFPCEDCDATQWRQARSQEEAAEMHAAFLADLIDAPYMIGYQRCQFVSAFTVPGRLLKQGLVDRRGRRYEPYCSMAGATHRRLIERWRDRIGAPRP